MTTKVTSSVLNNTSVTSGTYGGTAQQVVATVDAQGRLTYAANVATLITATNITDGTITSAKLTNTGVTATTYGNTSTQVSVTVDAQGRVISASNVTPVLTGSNITDGTITSAKLAAGTANTNIGYIPYNSANPAGYITGITSGNVTTALGYTPYNSTNPNGYITGINSSQVTTALGYTPYNSTNPSGFGTGTVTSVSTGNGLSGGTITTSGTISLGAPSFGSIGTYIIGTNTGGSFTLGSNYGSMYARNQTNNSQSVSGTWMCLSVLAGQNQFIGCSGSYTSGLFVRVA